MDDLFLGCIDIEVSTNTVYWPKGGCVCIRKFEDM